MSHDRWQVVLAVVVLVAVVRGPELSWLIYLVSSARKTAERPERD